MQCSSMGWRGVWGAGGWESGGQGGEQGGDRAGSRVGEQGTR